MAIGKNIKRELAARNLTAKWLADSTGIPASTIRSMIHRDSFGIAEDRLMKIADALGTTPEILVIGATPRNAQRIRPSFEIISINHRPDGDIEIVARPRYASMLRNMIISKLHEEQGGGGEE